MDIGTIIVVTLIIVFCIAYSKTTQSKAKPSYTSNTDLLESEPTCCVLCSRTKKNVEHMISGRGVGVCSGCMIDALLLIDENIQDLDNNFSIVHKIIAQKIARTEPNAIGVQKLGNYIDSICQQSDEIRESFLSEFVKLKSYKHTIKLLALTPETEWRYYHALNWQWANYHLGQFNTALKHPNIVLPENESRLEKYKLHYRTNQILNLLELSPSNAEVSLFLDELLALLKIYDPDAYPLTTKGIRQRPYIVGAIANCYFKLGQYEEAKKHIDELRDHRHLSADTELLRGDIYSKLGEQEFAEESWRNGLTYEPEGIFHLQLKERLQNR